MVRLVRRSFLSLFLLAVLPIMGWSGADRTAEAQQALYKAIRAYERGDYGGAKISVALALEALPNFAEAVMLKGILLHRDGKTEEAEVAFKKALELNPRLPEAIRSGLEKKAHEAEAELTQEDFSHFRIQFHGAAQRDKAWQAVKELDSAYNYLGSRFGSFPPEKISVIIFNTEEFWDAWAAPMWLGGFYDKRDGKVRVRLDDPPGGEEEMSRRLRHEFTHAFIRQKYPKDLPMWFQEGVAQFYAYANANDSFWKDKRLEELRKLTKGAPWMDMTKIQQAIEKKDVAPGLIYLAYLESEAMALLVAKDHGDSWVPRVIEELNKGSTFDVAFQTVVGITPARAMEQLQALWN